MVGAFCGGLKRINFFSVLFLCCFFLLVVLNFQHLSNPPYWDDIIGLHNQALWLCKNDFNIIKLWTPQNMTWGGANVYRFSIIPYFYASLYSFFSPETVHIIGHIFNIACLSSAFALSFLIIKRFSRNNLTALLWSITALTEPVVSGRTAASGQECPLIAGLILCLYFASRRDMGKLLVASILLMFIKQTGEIMTMAVSCWLLCGLLLQKKSGFVINRVYIRNLIIIVLCSFAGFVLFLFSGQAPSDSSHIFKLGAFIKSIWTTFSIYLPVQAMFLITAVISLLCYCIFLKRRKSFTAPCRRDWFCVLLLILICGFYMGFLWYDNRLPRYTSFVVFPMAMFLSLTITHKTVSRIAAIVFIVIGVAVMDGRFYLPIPPDRSRSGEMLERSREYLVDLRLNQQLCQLLEQKAFYAPIVAKWPYAQMLSAPEFGYVSKKIPNVYCGCVNPQYPQIKRLPSNGLLPKETIYLYSPIAFEFWLEFGPPLYPRKGDRVICHQKELGGGLMLYQRHDWKVSIFNRE